MAAERDVTRLHDHPELLWETASILLTCDEPDDMLRELFERIRRPYDLDLCVWLGIDDKGAIHVVSCTFDPNEARDQLARAAFAPVPPVATPGEVAPVARMLVERAAWLLDQLGARTASCHALIVGSRVVGVLGFASRRRDRFDGAEVEVLQAVCQQVTVAHDCLRVVSQLREQDRHKDEFLATLSHELRTPLSAMRNALQLLRLVSGDPAMLLQARSILDRQVQHMVRLVDDLLDVSRINSNRLTLKKEWVELATVVKSALETSRPAIEASRHELSVTLPAQPVLLDADPLRLSQALANLLNNAAKYTEAGGRISLSAEQQGNRIIIHVRDSGIGIPADTLPHVFGMYTQSRQSVERSQGGLGIGLSLVKRLVELHGGTVEARSEGPGKGSEFIVRLPVLVVPRE